MGRGEHRLNRKRRSNRGSFQREWCFGRLFTKFVSNVTLCSNSKETITETLSFKAFKFDFWMFGGVFEYYIVLRLAISRENKIANKFYIQIYKKKKNTMQLFVYIIVTLNTIFKW